MDLTIFKIYSFGVFVSLLFTALPFSVTDYLLSQRASNGNCTTNTTVHLVGDSVTVVDGECLCQVDFQNALIIRGSLFAAMLCCTLIITITVCCEASILSMILLVLIVAIGLANLGYGINILVLTWKLDGMMCALYDQHRTIWLYLNITELILFGLFGSITTLFKC